jgi:hypothetical protein
VVARSLKAWYVTDGTSMCADAPRSIGEKEVGAEAVNRCRRTRYNGFQLFQPYQGHEIRPGTRGCHRMPICWSLLARFLSDFSLARQRIVPQAWHPSQAVPQNIPPLAYQGKPALQLC